MSIPARCATSSTRNEPNSSKPKTAWCADIGLRSLCRRPAGLQDRVGGFQDPLCGPFWNRIVPVVPMMDVAARELRTGQAENFQTEHRDRFRFYLAKVARRIFPVGKI